MAGRASSHPVALATAGGLFIGVMAYVMPLTLFSGSGELKVIVNQGPALGAGLLVAVVVAKMLTFAVSIRPGSSVARSSRCSSSAAPWA